MSAIADVKIIDTDTHWSEPPDLWTSRAPSKYADRVPQLTEKEGKLRWWFDGDIAIGTSIASSVIDTEGEKMLGASFFGMEDRKSVV